MNLKGVIAKLKKSSLLSVKRHIKLFSTIMIILMIILGVIIIPSFFKESSTVSSEGLKDYIEEYLSEYRRLVEENMGLLDRGFVEGSSQSGSHNLTFYWHSPNKIDGVISLTHGAAIFFNYSERKIVEISIKSFAEPVEYYIWPEMPKNTEDLPVVRVLKASGYYHLDTQVSYSYGLMYVDPGANLRYTGEGRAFNISGNGAIVIFGSLIEEDRMILKGSNSKEDWSKRQARFDALSEFAWDCREILNETTIKTLEAKYKLPLLLDRISYRIETGRYRDNPALFTADFEELKEVGAPNETLSKILNDYSDMQENPPPEWYESLWSICLENLGKIIVAVTSTIIGAIIVKVYVEPRIKKRRKHKSKNT